MKRILLTSIAMFIGACAFAQTIHVEAITPFNTANPPHHVQMRALEDIQITPTIKIHHGDTITASMIDIKDPKRLKRDATFKFKISSITTQVGNTILVEDNNIAKFVPEHKLDKKELAKSAALSVGNHFIEGLSYGYRAIEGAVKSEEDGFVNRTKSAGKHVYEKSMFSYASKGHEVDINSGEIFGLKINSQEEINDFNAHNAPNYSYEMK